MKGAVMPMHLVPLTGGPAIPIDKPILFFGRQPECDVVLLNSRKVSRKHCCIAQIDDHLVVRDLGSMNGVRVNDKPVTKECRIAVGDEVYIGDVGYRLEVRAAEKKPPLQPSKKGAGAISFKPAAPKAPVGKPVRRVDPKFLSQDLPVAIPDEELDFIVEETQRKINPAKLKRPKEEDAIELEDIDIIED
jgi:FHA domain